MSVVALVPKYARIGAGFSRREQAEANIHPGRRTDGRQSAASWIADLADTKKVIILCQFCQGKFDPRRHGYRRFYAPSHTNTDPHQVNGKCDACKAMTISSGGRAYVTEETYGLLCRDPLESRRASRAAWRRHSFWDAVRHNAARVWGQRAAL